MYIIYISFADVVSAVSQISLIRPFFRSISANSRLIRGKNLFITGIFRYWNPVFFLSSEHLSSSYSAVYIPPLSLISSGVGTA
jgi:hypothetical protein